LPETNAPEKKQEFDVEYASLCDVQRAVMDGAAKLAGFFLLAIGWIATAESARTFLRNDSIVRQVATLAVAGVLALALAALWFSYRQSREIYDRLVGLDYLPKHCFESRVITKLALAIYMAGNALLAVLVLAVLLRLS
jgi:hypothetical protein